MAAGHIASIVLRAAEAQVGAPLRQTDKADGLALRVEHHNAVEHLRFALQRKHLATANIGRFIIERAIAAIAAPEIAVPVDFEAVEGTEIGGIDELRLVEAWPSDEISKLQMLRLGVPFHSPP